MSFPNISNAWEVQEKVLCILLGGWALVLICQNLEYINGVYQFPL